MSANENTTMDLASMKLREKFIQDLNGTTMGDVILYCHEFPLLLFVAVSLELWILNKFCLTSFKLAPTNSVSAIFVFLIESLMIIVPTTLMFTVLSDYIWVFLLVVTGITTVILMSNVSRADDQILYWKFTDLNQVWISDTTSSKKQLFIAYFRSFVLLVSAIAILGVDFHVFPRRFAKTETYGVSLMDLGVGMFIVSNALVEKKSSSFSDLKKTLSSNLVLLVLGLLRCVVVQLVDYQTHVTEYGTHWNFFFTLAFVRLLSSVILIIFRGHSLASGIILTVMHQYFLNHSLESLVFSNKERNNLFLANREGIISLSGYLSIHLIGITISSLVNPVNKYQLAKHKSKSIVIFGLISVFLLSALQYFESVGLRVSRRLANLPYVLWVTAVCLQLLVLFLLVEFMSCCFLKIDPKHVKKPYKYLMPVILESINYNGLLFFLMSNFSTGLINVYIDAFSSGSVTSVIILLSYSLFNCVVVYVLYILDLRLKF